MKHSTIILFLLFCFTACSPKFYPIERTDSVRVEIRERVVHDTTYLEIPKEVEKVVTPDTTSHLENDYAISDVSVKDGLLYHSLETKPQKKPVPVAVPVSDTSSFQIKTETITLEVEKPLTKWQSFQIIFGRISAILFGILLLAFLAIFIAKRFVK